MRSFPSHTKTYHRQDKGECYEGELSTIGELGMDDTVILCISKPRIVDDGLYEWGHIHPRLCCRVLK